MKMSFTRLSGLKSYPTLAQDNAIFDTCEPIKSEILGEVNYGLMFLGKDTSLHIMLSEQEISKLKQAIDFLSPKERNRS